MKRMVKNGDLIDVEPDGSITVAGKPIGGGGGGSDYTAGSNIEISEAKEISVKSDITGINKIDLGQSDSCIISGENEGGIKVETKYKAIGVYYPHFTLKSADASHKNIRIIFLAKSQRQGDVIYFDASDSNGTTLYTFLTKGKVPLVPNSDGTYVLKATVSGGAITYTWVAQ